MKTIEKEILVRVNSGLLMFKDPASSGKFTGNLGNVFPEIWHYYPEKKVKIVIELAREPGWYWVMMVRGCPYVPLYWNGEAWHRVDAFNCPDEGVYKINETRIPEPTDG